MPVNFRLHIFYDYNFCPGLDLMVLGAYEIRNSYICLWYEKLHTEKSLQKYYYFMSILLSSRAVYANGFQFFY